MLHSENPSQIGLLAGVVQLTKAPKTTRKYDELCFYYLKREEKGVLIFMTRLQSQA